PALVLTGLALLALLVALPLFSSGYGEDDYRVTIATFFAWGCGMVAGAILLAGESESGTQPMLDVLPKWRAELFRTQLLFGLALTAAESAVLVAAGMATSRGRGAPGPARAVAVLGVGGPARTAVRGVG